MKGEPEEVYLIAGLGNPGPDYWNTRHNVGFRVVEAWAGSLGVCLSERFFQSRLARTEFRGRNLLLLCPMTYMNRSGIGVQACAQEYGIEAGKTLIVYDDLDLPLGRVRVARGGGAGGHKGVSSVIEHVGTQDVPRVRIGIGRPGERETVEEYVLSPFRAEEEEGALRVIQLGVQACEVFVVEGVDAAMNAINGQNLIQVRRE